MATPVPMDVLKAPYGFWRRLVALAVDVLVLELISALIGLLAYAGLAQIAAWSWLIGLGLAILYLGLGNSAYCRGQTLGKWMTRLTVVDGAGQWLTLPTAIQRAALVSLLVFPDLGEAGGRSLLMAPWSHGVDPSPLLFVSQLVLGVIQAIALYLVLANGRTRQTLHDLVFRTYVVKLECLTVDRPLVMWRWHLLIGLALGVAVAMINPPPYRLFYSKSHLSPDLVALEQSIQSLEPVAGVHALPRSQILGSEPQPLILDISLWCRQLPEQPDQLAQAIADQVTQHYPEEEPLGTLLLTINYGYDLGFARGQQSFRYHYEWNGTAWVVTDSTGGERTVTSPHLLQVELDAQGRPLSLSIGTQQNGSMPF